MVDLVTNNINVDGDEYEHSDFEILQNSNQHNIVRSYSYGWDLISTNISNDINDFHRLKVQINSFIKDHPTVVNEIQRYFSDELIEHILKRLFRVQFTIEDSVQTNILYHRFFVEQDKNIRIIFNYFFDDIRLLILTGKFEGLPRPFRHAIIYAPKSLLLQLTITWLKFKGADSLTTILYRNLLNPIPDPIEEESSKSLFSFDRKKVYLFLIMYILVLFAINIDIIGTIINCSSGILLIFLIFYNS